MRRRLEQLKKARKGVLLGLSRQVISCTDILAAHHATLWTKCTVKRLHHEVVNARCRRLALARHIQCQNLVSLLAADQELLLDAGPEVQTGAAQSFRELHRPFDPPSRVSDIENTTVASPSRTFHSVRWR